MGGIPLIGWNLMICEHNRFTLCWLPPKASWRRHYITPTIVDASRLKMGNLRGASLFYMIGWLAVVSLNSAKSQPLAFCLPQKPAAGVLFTSKACLLRSVYLKSLPLAFCLPQKPASCVLFTWQLLMRAPTFWFGPVTDSTCMDDS